jgi:hypothetical protein
MYVALTRFSRNPITEFQGHVAQCINRLLGVFISVFKDKIGGHVASMKEMRNTHNILAEIREGKMPLWRRWIDGRIALKWV